MLLLKLNGIDLLWEILTKLAKYVQLCFMKKCIQNICQTAEKTYLVK